MADKARIRSLGDRLGSCVFVTVGTTKFKELTEAVLCENFIKMLVENGFSKLVVQAGKEYKDVVILRVSAGFTVDVYDYKPSLQEDMKGASLVISHGGSGSITEALSLHKPLIAVTNSRLMNNHQHELTGQLSREGCLVSTTPSELYETVQNFNPEGIQPYQVGDPAVLGSYLDDLMNFKTKSQ